MDSLARSSVAEQAVFGVVSLFPSFLADGEANIRAEDDRVLTVLRELPDEPVHSALTGCLSFSFKL